MAKQHSERFIILVNDALTRVEEITPEEVRKKQENDDDGFILLDIREVDEWDKARISEAKHLSKGLIEQEIESEIPNQEKEIVLYCSDGYRSALAADNLQKMGYHDVKLLKGGFRAWNEAGLPIHKKEA